MPTAETTALNLEGLATALDERLVPALFDRFNGRVLLRCQLPQESSGPPVAHARPGTGEMPAGLSLKAQAETDLGFELQAGRFAWCTQRRADAVFYFASPDAAFALLTGRTDPMQAFSAGALRASGYLVWTPVILGLFRGNAAAP